MPLLEHFIVNTDKWAIAPSYIAYILQKKYNITLRTLTQPPQDEIIYYLQPKEPAKLNSYNAKFLQLLKASLAALHPEITLLI